MLLIITVGTAFIRNMLQGQSQAASDDLSRSALDSAYAGVEDAKRVLAEYYGQKCDTQAGAASVRCTMLIGVLKGAVDAAGWTNDCTLIPKTVLQQTGTADGIAVRAADGSGADLDQAYTCLKIQMETMEYRGTLTTDNSSIVKLQSRAGDPKMVRFEWHMIRSGQTLNVDDGTVQPYRLPQKWPDHRPAVVKAQLLQFKGGFTLAEFDADSTRNASLFLLPAATGVNPLSLSMDTRRSGVSGAAQNVRCVQAAVDYACSVDIALPDIGDPSQARTAYLKLNQFYVAGATNFRVMMLDAAGRTMPFTDVQSTGRANELFRRVRSYVDVGVSSVPSPESAVDVTKSLCKEFTVTDTQAILPNPSDGCPALPQ